MANQNENNENNEFTIVSIGLGDDCGGRDFNFLVQTLQEEVVVSSHYAGRPIVINHVFHNVMNDEVLRDFLGEERLEKNPNLFTSFAGKSGIITLSFYGENVLASMAALLERLKNNPNIDDAVKNMIQAAASKEEALYRLDFVARLPMADALSIFDGSEWEDETSLGDDEQGPTKESVNEFQFQA